MQSGMDVPPSQPVVTQQPSKFKRLRKISSALLSHKTSISSLSSPLPRSNVSNSSPPAPWDPALHNVTPTVWSQHQAEGNRGSCLASSRDSFLDSVNTTHPNTFKLSPAPKGRRDPSSLEIELDCDSSDPEEEETDTYPPLRPLTLAPKASTSDLRRSPSRENRSDFRPQKRSAAAPRTHASRFLKPDPHQRASTSPSIMTASSRFSDGESSCSSAPEAEIHEAHRSVGAPMRYIRSSSSINSSPVSSTGCSGQALKPQLLRAQSFQTLTQASKSLRDSSETKGRKLYLPPRSENGPATSRARPSTTPVRSPELHRQNEVSSAHGSSASVPHCCTTPHLADDIATFSFKSIPESMYTRALSPLNSSQDSLTPTSLQRPLPFERSASSEVIDTFAGIRCGQQSVPAIQPSNSSPESSSDHHFKRTMEALEGRNRPHALRQISNSSSNPESARSRFSDSASSQMSTEDSNEDRDPLLSCTTRNTFDISRCGSCDHRSGTSASTGHARLCEMVAIDSSSESDHSRLLKSSDTSMTSNISFGQVANSYFTQRPGTINPIIPTSSHPYTICRDDTEDMSTAMETMNLQSIQSPSPQTRLSAQNRIRTLELALKREQDENRRLKLRLRETSSS